MSWRIKVRKHIKGKPAGRLTQWQNLSGEYDFKWEAKETAYKKLGTGRIMMTKIFKKKK